MKIGIVICSRLESSRVPRKALMPINGRSLLEHLIRRVLPSGHHVYIAVPEEDFADYRDALVGMRGVSLAGGCSDDPLARMAFVTEKEGLDAVIRITHDKIFVNPDAINKAVRFFYSQDGLDYVFSSRLPDGCGFEIISRRALLEAAKRFKNVEHISYAIRAVTPRIADVDLGERTSHHRLLVDYHEDVQLMQDIVRACGNDCTQLEALEFLDRNPSIAKRNQLPLLTVYTCAYNAGDWLRECMESVRDQSVDFPIEYILVDDGSTDLTPMVMHEFALGNESFPIPFPVTVIRTENKGLASASNTALECARGKFVMRLDADDYLTHPNALIDLLEPIRSSDLDAVYPAHFDGDLRSIMGGAVKHHVGGAVFRTKAINAIKFTDGLRGYEGYDFFKRAQGRIKIGYLQSPTFFYRQHEGSLSKQNPEERARIKSEIDQRVAQGTW